MVGAQGMQVIAKGASSPARGLQMPEGGHRFEEEPEALRREATGEIALEPIRRAHEVLVEPADGERDLTADRKVAGHEVIYPRGRGRRESKFLAAGERRGTGFPGLKDLPGDEG